MYLKELKIESGDGKEIRKISFHKGLNLIIDETKSDDIHLTGNSVGKTTVLKLIDFCLAGSPNHIYTDNENKKKTYDLIKNFLTENSVNVILTLSENLDDSNAKEIKIKRNFLTRSKIIREINDVSYTENDFEQELKRQTFPSLITEKPTFRQVIAHNIRWQDESINNTLKVLDKYTSDIEYETLYLYLFNCNFEYGHERQNLILKMNEEIAFKQRLEKKQNRSAYEAMLVVVENEIKKLSTIKSNYIYNDNLKSQIEKLNGIKKEIAKINFEITSLNLRKNLIENAIQDLESNNFDADLNVLRMIYEQAQANIGTLQKSFEDLVNYHNQMIKNKSDFIRKDLPNIIQKINEKNANLNLLLSEDERISENISHSKSFDEMEAIISKLNEEYRKKGEYEKIIEQIDESENVLKALADQMQSIQNALFSSDFEEKLRLQLKKFNIIFSEVSSKLYSEQYAIKYAFQSNRKGQKYFKFDAFNTNMSAGKKQGEIVCFDFAYILFARQENMDYLNFLLSDKKELMHDNQLINIAHFVNRHDIQFVMSILKDKLPEELNDGQYAIITLSQEDKLFRV